MSRSTRALRWRSISLFVAGTVLGALLVAPIAAGATRSGVAPKAITYTRSASCPGSAFQPLDSGVLYGGAAGMRVGNGRFTCDPGLPHRAVVTRLRVTIADTTSAGRVGPCELNRVGLSPAHGTDAQQLADIPGTTSTGTPGTVRLGDSTISYAKVDTVNHGYWVQCFIGGNTGDAQLYGADVTYTISAANG